MKNPDISFVIVSYNTADLIETCILSVEAIRDCAREVIVVENASLDESLEKISQFPSVRLIVNEKNRGFGPANNQALPFCRGRYIFFLNPDTRVKSATLRKTLAFMDDHAEIGLAGVKVLNPDSSDQESLSFSYPGQRYAKSELNGLPGPIAWVLGAGMIARTELIHKLGGFDEDFFLYGEEQDLCLRIRKSGYEIGFCDAFKITHFSGQSERTSNPEEIWKKKTAAEYLFYRKHYLPETIRKIAAEDLIKAEWRILSIKSLSLFMRQEDKLAKYKVMRDNAIQMRRELKEGISMSSGR